MKRKQIKLLKFEISRKKKQNTILINNILKILLH